ncbi:hypothetical protein [Kitasatospora sp. Ki12]
MVRFLRPAVRALAVRSAAVRPLVVRFLRPVVRLRAAVRPSPVRPLVVLFLCPAVWLLDPAVHLKDWIRRS